jgi:hypothetical protein
MSLMLPVGLWAYELSYFVSGDAPRQLDPSRAATNIRNQLQQLSIVVPMGRNPRVETSDVPLSSFRVTAYVTMQVNAPIEVFAIDRAVIQALRGAGWERTSLERLLDPLVPSTMIGTGRVSINPFDDFGEVQRRITVSARGTQDAPPPIAAPMNRVVNSSVPDRVGAVDNDVAGAITRRVENTFHSITHPSGIVVVGMTIAGVTVLAVGLGYAYRSFK